MKRRGNKQYTLRQIPPAVDDALRKKSRESGKSMNQTAVEALRDGLRVRGDVVLHHDLAFMAGSWVEDPGFDEAVRSQSQVDPKLWQ